MAEAQEAEINILTCKICLELFKEPKALPCLHRFCKSCLSNNITLNIPASTSESRGFHCPCCRAFTRAQNPAKPRSEWAAQFQTDFDFKKLISIRSENNYLCPTHVATACEYYCVDCSQIICHRCVLLGPHNTCRRVEDVRDAADERRIQIEKMIEQTRAHLATATHSENLYVELQNAIENKRDTMAREIKTFADDLRQRVTEEENDLLKQLNIKYDSLTLEVHSEMLKVTEVTDAIEERLTSLSNIHSSYVNIMLNNCAMDIARDSPQQDLSTIGEHFNRMASYANSVKITLHKARLPSPFMGSIVMSHCHQDISNLNYSTLQEFPRITLDRSEHIQALDSIDIQCAEVGARAHNFIVMTPTNSIIVIDPYKKCIRMFCSDRQRNDSLALEGRPLSITQLSQTMAAVSLPNVQQICFIKITATLEIDCYISCRPYSWLATLNSNTLVAASNMSPLSIDIIKLNGQVLRSFTSSINTDIPTSFPNLVRGLIVTPEKMILATFSAGGSTFSTGDYLLCLSPEGETKFKSPQRNIKSVACDSSGRIFLVADDMLLILTSDGQPDGTMCISTDNILTSPTDVCVAKDGLVYVVNDDCREIKVLKVRGGPAI